MKEKIRLLVMITLSCLLISNMFLSVGGNGTDAVHAANQTTKQLKEMNTGDEITFAGKQWVVLDPDKGYVFMKDQLTRRLFNYTNDSFAIANKFDPTSPPNLGYYLNKTYYNQLASFQKKVIQESEWDLGKYGKVTAKIGLLSKSEWERYANKIGMQYENYNDDWFFLLTPGEGQGKITIAYGEGSSQTVGARFLTQAVNPALELNPNVLVSDGEVLPTADVSFSPNGNSDWAESHSTEVNVSLGNDNPDLKYAWSTKKETPTNADWESFDNGDSLKTPANKSGDNYLHIRGLDYLDHPFQTVSKAFKTDNKGPEKPTINISSDWTNAKTFTIYAGKDGGIGTKETKYSIHHTRYDGPRNWNPFRTSSYTPPLWNDGKMKFLARSTDEFGHKGEQLEKIIKIDWSDPTIKMESDQDDNKSVKKASIKVSVSDEDSGVDDATLQYVWAEKKDAPGDEANWKTFENGQTIKKDDASGTWYLHVKAADKAGNPTEKTSHAFHVDVDAPEISFEPNSNDQTQKEVSTKISVSDEDSGVDDETLKYVWTQTEDSPKDGAKWLAFESGETIKKDGASGIWYLHVKAADKIGNPTEKTSDAFHVDVDAPEISFEPNGNDQAQKEVSTKISVSDDDSGVDDETLKYAWSKNKDISDGKIDWTKFKRGDSLTKDDASGTWYVHVKAQDKAGNTAQKHTKEFQIDRTAPDVNLDMTAADEKKYDHDTWANEPVHVSVTAQDALSGMDAWTVEVNGDEEDVDNGNDPYTYEKDFDQDGTYELTIKAADQAGNETTKERTIKIDQQKPDPPSIKVEPEEWTKDDKATVTLTGGEDKENGSGVQKTQYRIDDGDWVTYEESFEIEKEGDTAIEARTIDEAGNTSSLETAHVQLDRTKPEMTFENDGQAKPAQQAATGVTVTDEDSGVEKESLKYVWSKDKKLEDDTNWIPFDNDKELKAPKKNGIWYLHVKAQDKAGNTAQKHTKAFQIDRTAPDVNLDMTTADQKKYDHDTWANEPVHVSVTAQDALSGMDAWTVEVNGDEEDVDNGGDPYTYERDFDQDGTYELTIKAADQAGNESTKEKTIKIDQQKPGSPSIKLDPEGWTKDDKATVTLTGGEDKENGSGVQKTQYRIDDGDWATYEEPFEIEKEGDTAIEARTIDRAGNQSNVKKEHVNIDRTKPEVTFEENGQDESAQKASTEINVTDKNGSGVADDSLEYVWSTSKDTPDDETNWIEFENGDELTKTGVSGTWYLHVRAGDNAGNEIEKTTNSFHLDTAAPNVDFKTNGNDKAEQDVSTKGVVDDQGSGIDEGSLKYAWSTSEKKPDNDAEWVSFTSGDDIEKKDGDGMWYLHIRASDNLGNTTNAHSNIFHLDNTPPKLTLHDGEEVSTPYGKAFDDPGYDVSDNMDEDIEDKVKIAGEVDPMTVGLYAITYSAEDHAGNETSVTRTVNVKDDEKPVLTLEGDHPLTVQEGSTYAESGATAEDNRDGDLTDDIEITGADDIDTDKPGKYTVTYKVSDEAGNEAEKTRKVTVVSVETLHVNNPVSVLKTGDPRPLRVTATYSDDSTADIANKADYTFDADHVVSVDSNGVIKGIGARIQPVRVTANYKGARDSFTLRIVDQISNPDKNVDISPGDLLMVKDADTFVKFPDDWFKHASIGVNNVHPTSPSLSPAGDVLRFDVNTPDDQKSDTGDVVLKMKVKPAVNEEHTGVYYYHEDTKTWEYIGGTIKDGWMTVNVPHFSTYGVFTDTQDPSDVKVKATDLTDTSVKLSLSAQDPSGIKAYQITRNDGKTHSVKDKDTFKDEKLSPDTDYTYKVTAVDNMGNESQPISVKVTTAKASSEGNDNGNNPGDKHNNGGSGTDSGDNNDQSAGEKDPRNQQNHTSNGSGSSDSTDQDNLPQTASMMYSWLVAGLIFLFAGGIVLFIYYRRKKTVDK